MENENLPINPEDNIITLTDENNCDFRFEMLDCILYNDAMYVVLLSVDEDDDEVLILQVNCTPGETFSSFSECSLDYVEDEEALKQVFSIFKERAADRFNFV